MKAKAKIFILFFFDSCLEFRTFDDCFAHFFISRFSNLTIQKPSERHFHFLLLCFVLLCLHRKYLRMIYSFGFAKSWKWIFSLFEHEFVSKPFSSAPLNSDMQYFVLIPKWMMNTYMCHHSPKWRSHCRQ